MKRRLPLLLPAVAIIALLLTGCATEPTPSTTSGAGMTIAEAKARAQQLEDDIVALIPADIIKTTDQIDKARLMNCTGGVTWPGSTVITFTEPQDADAIVQKLHDDLDKTENAGNTIEQVDNDYLLATYITTDGATALIAEEADDGTSIRIDSNSPCFELPEGSSRHGKY